MFPTLLLLLTLLPGALLGQERPPTPVIVERVIDQYGASGVQRYQARFVRETAVLRRK